MTYSPTVRLYANLSPAWMTLTDSVLKPTARHYLRLSIMQPLSPCPAQNHVLDDKYGMVMSPVPWQQIKSLERDGDRPNMGILYEERKTTKRILRQALRQANAKSRVKIYEDIAESVHMDPKLFHRLIRSQKSSTSTAGLEL